MPDNDHVPLFWEEVADTFKNDPDVMFRLYEGPWLNFYSARHEPRYVEVLESGGRAVQHDLGRDPADAADAGVVGPAL